MFDKDKGRDLASNLNLQDGFSVADSDGGYAHRTSIQNGGLYVETWWSDDEILNFIAWAKESRSQETLMITTGALQNHFCELPASVLTWIIDKYKLADHLNTPEAKRKIFEAVEYDTIVPINNPSKKLELKLFKHTNKKLGKKTTHF